MTIYLIDRNTNKIIRTYTNVLSWNSNYVEYYNNGRGKYYCDEHEYFTNILKNND